MITQQRVMATLAHSNPVSDIEELDLVQPGTASYLATLEQRSSEVTQLDARPTEKTKEKPRRLILTLGTAAAAILIGALVILNQPGEATPAATQMSVVVPGTEPWTDTGIDISIDDTMLIEAEGEVTPKADARVKIGTTDTEIDIEGVPFNDPNGNPDPGARMYNVEGLREAGHAALIGRIGEDGVPFQVGSQLLAQADAEGRLFLGINDTGVDNNDGEFTATITVNP